jgi:hypothetical protein
MGLAKGGERGNTGLLLQLLFSDALHAACAFKNPLYYFGTNNRDVLDIFMGDPDQRVFY